MERKFSVLLNKQGNIIQKTKKRNNVYNNKYVLTQSSGNNIIIKGNIILNVFVKYAC